ncbi:hypothetical protein T492DRAFT_988009 [Pavlovales sp. CCMP2436]|nr:hypothetical protein T492DRAFT_988009 [Pavlovales sp. CCMP2436]
MYTIIGAVSGLCLLCGAGAFLLFRMRKRDNSFRKNLRVATNVVSSDAVIARAPPPAPPAPVKIPSRRPSAGAIPPLRPPAPIRRRSSGLHYAQVV